MKSFLYISGNFCRIIETSVISTLFAYLTDEVFNVS